jgi:hypothetical protein
MKKLSRHSQPPSRRRRLEAVAMGIMAVGAFMLFQPFALVLYSYSFVVFLAGVIMFVVVSHFED